MAARLFMSTQHLPMTSCHRPDARSQTAVIIKLLQGPGPFSGARPGPAGVVDGLTVSLLHVARVIR